MFWSRVLWDKCGNVISEYRYAGDYHLWKEFAKYQPLVTLDSVIFGFRIHEGQKSGDREKYYSEIGSLHVWGRALQKTRVIKTAGLVYSIFTKKEC